MGSGVAEASKVTLAVEIFGIEVLREAVRSACSADGNLGWFVEAAGGVVLASVCM